MKWFSQVENLQLLRKEYKRLVIKHHPDNGGSEEVIKEINIEYEQLFQKLKNQFQQQDSYQTATEKQKQSYDWQKDIQIRNMILQLSRFPDITVEMIGVWIWVSNGYPYRKE